MLDKKVIIRRIKKFAVITFAALLYGIANTYFSDPNNLAPGGITGVAIVLNKIWNMGVGMWFILINIPILLLGIWQFGLKFTISTIYATAMVSFFTDMLSLHFKQFIVNDMVLGATFGGALMAISMGLIFKNKATTGGTDIIIKILRKKFPHLKTGSLFFLTDVVIIVFAGVVLQDIKVTLYSMISVMITSYVLDLVLYGRDEAKLLYIISDRPDIITKRLLEELDIGATHIYGQGAYTGNDKKVIMAGIKKRLSPLAEEIVREEDPDAFMIVTSATEIFGEGYKSYFDERI
jgi:uncharacterized membrane-anchored protein YitT (DUF2179 family)